MQNIFIKEDQNIPPIGYVLREQYNIPCIRIHNFINKQYPENEHDKQTLIKLYNKIFDFFDNKNITTFLSLYDEPINTLDNSWIKILNFKFFKELNINAEVDDKYLSKIYTFDITNKSIINDIIFDVANEELEGNILFVCTKNGSNIFLAPYPGGIDIFTEDKNIQKDIQNYFNKLNITIQKCPVSLS